MSKGALYQDIPKTYSPATVEEQLYRLWEEKGYFTPTIDWSKKPFTIIMPPPNVTGELHLGHALCVAIEDAIVRYHRMLGTPTLWLPGSDHAGIATQMVVERVLAKEGLTRHDLGRTKFEERVWEWVRLYGDVIDNQHRRLGASCDWTRKKFTLDDGPSLAVRTTFVNLYQKGLVYRGERIINWCPRCATALSDLEVEHKDTQGHLYYIRYRLEDDSGYVTVATTRPETLLGDAAVAVHPEDSTHLNLIGQRVLLPILGRTIPVIADTAVAVKFGTGALKITPGHDGTDFEIGQRHNLPVINIMNQDATLNAEAGPYEGYDRDMARAAIIRELESEALLEKMEPYMHAVGHCQRCDTVVEPLVSKQWFVDTRHMAEKSTSAVNDGRIRIIPERFTKVYLNWMSNIRDWCISRQLWWGHRIPVWYCDSCGETIVQIDDPLSCHACGSKHIRQDPDVLDTWFSSALWPHSTLGWPVDTEDLRYFYPTSVMETGYDILFFWVARMVMMGLQNVEEIPFHTIFLHGLVRDEHGVKMSKTRGNVLDPIKAIDEYGTDALRFALTTGGTPGSDIRLTKARLESSRNFANKLWNASRFVINSLEQSHGLNGWFDAPPRKHLEDRWILSRLNRLIVGVWDLWDQYQIGEAQRQIHDFLWGEYCDWYIELAKVRLRSGDYDPLQVLAHVLERTLRLLHPFMPFITETIWQNLRARLPIEGLVPESIMIASYPAGEERVMDSRAEEEVGLVIEIVRGIRNARTELRVDAGRQVEAWIGADESTHVVVEEANAIKHLARVNPLHVSEKPREFDTGDEVTLVLNRAEVVLALGGLVDLVAERQRFQSEMSKCEQNIQRLQHRLQDQQFIGKAPEEVVEREHQRLYEAQERQSKIQILLNQLFE